MLSRIYGVSGLNHRHHCLRSKQAKRVTHYNWEPFTITELRQAESKVPHKVAFPTDCESLYIWCRRKCISSVAPFLIWRVSIIHNAGYSYVSDGFSQKQHNPALANQNTTLTLLGTETFAILLISDCYFSRPWNLWAFGVDNTFQKSLFAAI